MRQRGWLLFLCGWLWAASGCSADAPNLIALEQLQPSAVETHDELLLTGRGFVDQAPATLSFVGDVHRVGEAPVYVDFAIKVAAQSGEHLRLPVAEPLVREFLANAHHGTFRGEVRVAFPPRTAGAPPVTGVLKHVAIDVFAAGRGPSDEEKALSAALLKRFGWQLAQKANGRWCLASQDQAEVRSALLLGDCIEQFAGLNVFSREDLVPAPGAKRAALVVRRDANLSPQTVQLDITHLRPASPAAWGWPLVLVGLIAGTLLVCRGPLATALCLLETRLQRAHSSSAKPTRLRLGRGLVAFLGISALFAALRVGLVPLSRDYDVLLVFVAVTPLFAAAQLVGASLQSRMAWGARVRALLAALAVHITPLLALSVAVFESASLSLTQLSKAQADQALGLFFFSSPGAYLAGIALLLAATLLGLLDFSSARPKASTRLRAALAHALSDLYAWALAALFVALYAGGWEWNAWGSGTPRSQTLLSLLWFQLKLSVLFGGLVLLRQRLQRMPWGALSPVFVRSLLPLSLAGATLHLVWISGTWPQWLTQSNTRVLLLGTVLLLGALWARLLWRRHSPASWTALNPWL